MNLFPTITDKEWKIGIAAARARRTVRKQQLKTFLNEQELNHSIYRAQAFVGTPARPQESARGQ
jgi:hypothetical protein